MEIKKDSWPVLAVFKAMQNLGNVDENEMYRTFNMGIGMVLIVPEEQKRDIFSMLKDKIALYEIGKIVQGQPKVSFI